MKRPLTKPQTLKFDHARIVVGLDDGVPTYAIVDDIGKCLFSGVIENETPDELIQVAIAMREVLEAKR